MPCYVVVSFDLLWGWGGGNRDLHTVAVPATALYIVHVRHQVQIQAVLFFLPKLQNKSQGGGVPGKITALFRGQGDSRGVLSA